MASVSLRAGPNPGPDRVREERRSDADGQAILTEALGALRQRGLIQ